MGVLLLKRLMKESNVSKHILPKAVLPKPVNSRTLRNQGGAHLIWDFLQNQYKIKGI